jgi:hypothetical protein
LLPIAVGEAGAGPAFAQAAFPWEILLQAEELAVYEMVGLVDEADGDVGDDLRRRLDELPVEFAKTTPQPNT